MKELEELMEAIYAGRFDGRIKAIEEAFNKYKDSLEKPMTRLRRLKRWFRNAIAAIGKSDLTKKKGGIKQ